VATAPYFVISPNTVLSILGLLRGPDQVEATPPEDWRTATVDVIIPALNEAEHITLCLASVLRQTLRPRRIVLVDDGSTDGTVELAEAYCRHRGVPLVAIRRRSPIGKTPTLKRQAWELDSDVEFILDADTALESEHYLARTVEELYRAVGVASVCGTILPLRRKDRRALQQTDDMRTFRQREGLGEPVEGSWWRLMATGVTNVYRDVLYNYLQRFIYRGQNVFFGTISNPVGCAVAYRRKYVAELFDHFHPLLGDDLTNSEDIFIGLAMIDKGYRNVQLTDVTARTAEPPCYQLPRQVYLWSSSFLQSCFYFDPLVRSPLKALRRALDGRVGRRRERRGTRVVSMASAEAGTGSRGLMMSSAIRVPTEAPPRRQSGQDDTVDPNAGGPPRVDRRRIREPYRQAFGRERTAEAGRPAGWMLLMSAVEKVFFPTSLIILMLIGNWEALAVTLAAETTVGLATLMVVMRGQRLEYLAKGLAVVPLRYAMLMSEVVTIGRFATDIWVRGNRRWRK
jgi:glycosyltransferase involved in cell wall biosynthesis